MKRNELNNLAPKLSGIRKENPFKVPDGYFESFAGRLTERIQAEEPVQVKNQQRLLKPILAVAAMILFAVIISNVIFRNSPERAAERIQSQVSQIVEEELYSISEETIVEILNPGGAVYSGPSTDNEEDMIDYLLNENVNEEDMLNAL